ncbi:hypothetical protein C2845_PM12G13150 [Panicum miliaceum]|uniref:ATP synthase mitochondrial F1 complex assembly factor 1 n=1 Tax=Panicum miliaceum TaxID=4540 RepID=A0A3L6QIR2_PANMI|nr:hypothetical protein C2845_PM12G13150 [Panicum miliaceum]
MRRLPVRLLRSAAAAARRAPAASHGGFPATPALHPAASAAAPSSSSADLSRWPKRRGYSQFASGFTPLKPKPKPLESIIDVERAKGLSPEHLVAAWDDAARLPQSHLSSVSVGLLGLLDAWTSISFGKRSYRCIYENKAVPSLGTKVIHMIPYMIFTGLEDYKARGTQASPYYTVTHYTEFAETKDTVLIRGDVVFTSKLTDSEAKTLLETAHSFYLNDVRYKLVERFNKETHEFEFKDVSSA